MASGPMAPASGAASGGSRLVGWDGTGSSSLTIPPVAAVPIADVVGVAAGGARSPNAAVAGVPIHWHATGPVSLLC